MEQAHINQPARLALHLMRTKLKFAYECWHASSLEADDKKDDKAFESASVRVAPGGDPGADRRNRRGCNKSTISRAHAHPSHLRLTADAFLRSAMASAHHEVLSGTYDAAVLLLCQYL